MVRAPTWEDGKEPPHTTYTHIQLNTAAPQLSRSAGTAAGEWAAFFIPENKINHFYSRKAAEREENLWHFSIQQ